MAIESAGILLYRGKPREVLLIHMGGPLWAKKDETAWSIPKGVIGTEEDALVAARREFCEETGFTVEPPFMSLGRFLQNKSKYLSVWAAEGDANPATLSSNTFLLEWPPHSGAMLEFPEADRAAWLGWEEACRRIVKGQRQALGQFFAMGI